MAETALSLTSRSTDRPVVSIDGEGHEVLPPNVGSVRHVIHRRKVWRELSEFFSEEDGVRKLKEGLSDDEFERYCMLLYEFAGLMFAQTPKNLEDLHPNEIAKLYLWYVDYFVKAPATSGDDVASNPTSS